MMTFEESEVNRSEDGKFATKTGAPADVVLSADVPVDEAVVEFRQTLNYVGRGSKRDWSLRDEVMRDRIAGRVPLYDENYADIWAGKAEGWSEEEVKRRLATIHRLRDDLAEERIVPNGFLARDRSVWTRDDINGWLSATEAELNQALETEGRSLVGNARAARPVNAR